MSGIKINRGDIKMKKKLIACIICSAMLIAACGQNPQEETKQTEIESTVVVVEESEVTQEEVPEVTEENTKALLEEETIEVSELIGDFHLLLKAEYTSVDIARFVEDRIDEATPSEAEYMLRYLLLYQTEFIKRGDEVLFFKPIWMP